MFIWIPLGLIVLCAIAIAVIVGRKIKFLAKLEADSHQQGVTIWHDFFPEFVEWFGTTKRLAYKEKILREFEKLLRRVRLVFTSIDRFYDSMIHKIRKAHRRSVVQSQIAQEQKEAQVEAVQNADTDAKEPTEKELNKKREQELVVAIAQNPKNVELYIELGEIYLSLKNLADAKESFKTVLKLDAENEKAKKELDKIIEKEGQNSDTK